MTKEEIKETCSMQSILEKYGLHPNNKGFISCPFHKGDREPSMKIYKDGYNCFGCGANGDIFSFVMEIESCSFKEAFIILGGTYECSEFHDKMVRYHSIKAKETKKKRKFTLEERKKLVNHLIEIYRNAFQKAEPFSDIWIDNYNKFQYMLYAAEYLDGRK